MKFLFLAACLAVGSFCFSWAHAADVTPEDIIIFTNEDRKNAGLNELIPNEVLSKAAEMKANDMIGNNYFAHTSPSGVDPWHWFGEAGYDYRYAGENLAMDFSSAKSVNDAWMKSESHKENILSPKYTEIGVAVRKGIIDSKETQIAVQLFGAREAGEQEAAIARVMQEFVSSVDIKEVSVYPWSGSNEDEALVYAKVEGKPVKVEVVYGNQHFELEELREDVFMNLISIKDIDFGNLDKDALTVKASIDEKQAVFYSVPSEAIAYNSSMEEEADEEDEMLSAAAYRDSWINNILFPNIILMIGFIFFIILILNIWILEKEDEKWILLHEA